MNIKNCTNAISAYRAASYDKDVKNKPSLNTKGKNTDKAEFSANKNSIDMVKASVSKSIDTSASTERISALKSLISEGKYNIPAENIASSMTEV